MKLRVKPLYGWGWRGPDNTVLAMPAEFSLEAEEMPKGLIKGRVSDPNHSLDGLWVVLSHRHAYKDGIYDLRAYPKQPVSYVEPWEMAGCVLAWSLRP